MKTLRNSSLITLVIVALALLVAAPVAFADSTAPQTTSVGLQSTDLVSVVTTPPVALFNTSLGTLTSVTITFQGGENSNFLLENTAAGPETFIYQESLDYYLGSANATINGLLGSLTPSTTNVNSLITLTANGDPGSTENFGPLTTPTSVDSVTITSNLALFEGVGNLPNFLVSTATFTSYSGGGGNENTVDSSQADGTVTVTYNYDTGNVPEPGTLSLFGTGLLGLAGMLRSRFGKAR
jgi:hypothetical protein